jgi:hypothetical protein
VCAALSAGCGGGGPLPRDLAGTLVFVSDRDGQDALYLRRLPGGADFQLTHLPEPVGEPALSPNGRQGGASSILGNPRYPFPAAGAGALIGVLRTSSGQQSQPFLVGAQVTFTAPADGRLFLLINDDNYSDNSGSFSVRIQVN